MISNNEFDNWGQQQQQTAAAQPNPEEVAGVDLMQVAMRRKGLIALGIFLGLCLGLLYFARATEKYESTAQLLVREKGSPFQTQEQMMFGVGLSKADDHAIGISSPRIINEAIENTPELAKCPSLVDAENKVEEILEGLEVTPLQEGSDVLQLVYKGTNAEDCRLVLDSIMATYRGFLNDERDKEGQDVVTQLTDARDILLEEKEQLSKEYEEWKKEKSRLLQQDDEGIILEQVQLAKVEEEIFEAENRIGKYASELSAFSDWLENPDADPEALLMMIRMSAPNGRGLPFEQDELERRMARAEEQFYANEQAALLEDEGLALRYGPDHPRRRALQRQIKLRRDLHSQLWSNLAGEKEDDANDAATTMQTLRSYIDSLKVSVQTERNELVRLRNESKKLAEAAKAKLADAAKNRWYQEQLANKKDLFDAAVKKLSEIDLSEQFSSGDRYRIERFSEPGIGIQTDPSLAKSLAGGMMLGFLAGFGLGYLVEMFDKTFRNPQEVSDTLQLPMIGHIPEIVPEPVENSAMSESLVAAHRPKSPLAENFRAIRTALYFTASNQQSRVIQTTSPVPGDGKSTLTANLAITMAQSNKSILVVDADFRRPSQHKMFGLKNDKGLASVVVGEMTVEDAVQATEVPNLTLLACGPRPHNPSELLTSPQFEELLQHLREQYDFVLIDTPPVLAVTDPGIVSARADGVIMALRIRKNGRPGAVRARKILKDLDANMLGIVVNGIDHRSGAYGYYSNYRRSYGYGGYGGYGKSQEQAEKSITKYYEDPAEEPQQQQTDEPTAEPPVISR